MVKGCKRHLVVDTLRLLLAVTMTAASVLARDGAAEVVARTCHKAPTRQWLYTDGAYGGQCAQAIERAAGADSIQQLLWSRYRLVNANAGGGSLTRLGRRSHSGNVRWLRGAAAARTPKISARFAAGSCTGRGSSAGPVSSGVTPGPWALTVLSPCTITPMMTRHSAGRARFCAETKGGWLRCSPDSAAAQPAVGTHGGRVAAEGAVGDRREPPPLDLVELSGSGGRTGHRGSTRKAQRVLRLLPIDRRAGSVFC